MSRYPLLTHKMCPGPHKVGSDSGVHIVSVGIRVMLALGLQLVSSIWYYFVSTLIWAIMYL